MCCTSRVASRCSPLPSSPSRPCSSASATAGGHDGGGTPLVETLPLQPPPITVLQHSNQDARGYIFVAPKLNTPSTLTQGPEIVDDQGRPVWFHRVVDGDQPTDFRVQRYRGQPVLTWWDGSSHTGPGHGEGTGYIADRHYRVIATVSAGNGLTPTSTSSF